MPRRSLAQHLQRCAQQLRAIQSAGTSGVTQPAPAQATTNWRRLVNVEQVPIRLLQACSDASTLFPIAHLLLGCLCVALNQLWAENSSSQTCISTAKQLLQAGLPQRLQTITETVVAALQQLPLPAAITEQLLNPEQLSPLQASWEAAQHLYALLNCLRGIFAGRADTVESAAVKQACSMQLSTATFQHLSCCLEHMPPQLASPPQVVTDLLEQACRAGTIEGDQWAMPDKKSSTEQWSSYLHLLSMQQQWVPSLGISLLVLTYATLLQDGSLPATSVPTRAADAWQLACSYADGARASHRELLKLLGCSSKTLLYAASTLSLTHKQCVLSIRETQVVYMDVLRAPQLKEQSIQQQLLTCGMAFLQPSVLLLWAGEYTGEEHTGVNLELRFAAEVSSMQWRCLKQHALQDLFAAAFAEHAQHARLLDRQHDTSQQPMSREWHVQQRKLDKQGRKSRQHTQQSQGVLERDQQQGVPASSQQQPGECVASLMAWLASLEPVALTDPVTVAGKVLRRILLQLQQLQEASRSCSSSNTTATTRASSSSTSHAASYLALFTAHCVHVVVGLGCLDSIHSWVVAAQQADTDTALRSLMCSTWQAHAGEHYRVIEEFVRWRLCAGGLPDTSVFSKAGRWGCYQLFCHSSKHPSVLLEAVAAAGPGGNRQLWSLAVTLMKAAAQDPQGAHARSLRLCG